MHDLGERNADDMPDIDTGSGLLGKTIRNVALLVGACLVLAYAVGQVSDGVRVAGTPRVDRPATGVASTAKPRPRPTAASYELVIPRGPDGHFFVEAVVQGETLRFLIDTGASTVMLTADDARRLGYRSDLLDFNRAVQTANGEILVAPVTLGHLRIGDLELEEISGMVTRAPLPVSLLGMSFLGRLAGYEVRDDGLVLRW